MTAAERAAVVAVVKRATDLLIREGWRANSAGNEAGAAAFWAAASAIRTEFEVTS